MNFRIVDPNQGPTRRLIAETDYSDIADTLARAYFTDRYVRQDPRNNNYAVRPVRVVDTTTGRCVLEIGFKPNPVHMVGVVGGVA